MSVRYRQTVENAITDEREIAKHFDAQTDEELLRAKFDGASTKGWIVEWTSPTSFVATKERWGGTPCVREFWID